MGTDWWRGAVGYEVYIRSFQDSDGDGIGDLAGVRRRLPYLADLGVDIVWLTPFYPSPQHDHGYDVADYRAVNPEYGTLEDINALIEDAHDLGLKVVGDLVPNHTSHEHRWFRSACEGRDAPYRDWYVWSDPAPDGGPPNNWVSHFGGPAWTWHEPTQQYYLHLFLPEQPDLNWRNEAVREEFDDILRFWFDRGLDGFRIDVAHALLIDEEMRDNPLLADEPPAEDADPRIVMVSYEHTYDQDQEEVLDIYRRWRGVAEEYDAMLLGEVYLLEPEKVTRYVATQDGLHAAFCFLMLHVEWDPDRLRDELERSVAAGSGAFGWPLSSHDDPRAASRFGGGARGSRRALAYLTVLCGLPGMPFILQGDELGLTVAELGEHETADPLAVRNPGVTGRDGSRTPMLWASEEGWGFTDGDPWLPFGKERTEADTVEAQQGAAGSHLERTRELFRVRHELTDLHHGATVDWLTDHGPYVAFRRGGVVVACNVGSTAADLPLPEGDWEVAFTSAGDAAVSGGGGSGAAVTVPADATAILRKG